MTRITVVVMAAVLVVVAVALFALAYTSHASPKEVPVKQDGDTLYVGNYKVKIVGYVGPREVPVTQNGDMLDVGEYKVRLAPAPFNVMVSPDGRMVLLFTWDRYRELKDAGKLGSGDAYNVSAHGVTLVVEEPQITRSTFPIGGTLQPGTADLYGPFTSAVAMDVSVSWTPNDQQLCIAIIDNSTREGYGYCYVGGTAAVRFGGLDWPKGYRIAIIILPSNTKTITYGDKITLHIW